MSAYTIQINSASPQTLASAAILSMQLHYVANGVDTLTITKKYSALSTLSAPFAYGDTVRLFHGATCVFVGTVETLPTTSDPSDTSGTYKILGPSHDLQLCDYSQSWYYRDPSGTLQSDYDPNVCLCDDNGTRITTGAQIAAVVAYAATRGLTVTAGTITPGLYAPYDQKSNIRCWDAIIAMLRYTPDHVVWWDYNNQVSGAYVPALNVTASTAMTPASYAHTSLNQISLTPRHDLVVPGVQVIFEMTSTVDGATYRTRSVQSAGNHTHPRRLSLLYPLDGFHSTTQKQPIEVEQYPALGANAATKNWAHANVLWLRRLIYTDWDIKSVTRSGSLALPNRLIKGTPVPWLEAKQDFETEDITIKVEYTKKNDSGIAIKKETKDITIRCLSTNCEEKTYTRQSSFQAAEPEPANFAADLYASWSILHYAGTVGLQQQTPTPAVRPGQTLNITGALPAWASMTAVIQDTTINLPSGQITHNLGPCPRLEADTLMAIFRSVRARRFSTERMTRDNPDETNDIWGPTTNPSSSISDGAPSDTVEHMTVESADGTKKISLQSSDLTGASAVEMKPREIKTIESDGATPPAFTQKTYQIMATEAADPVSVPIEGGDIPNLDVITGIESFGLDDYKTKLQIVFTTTNLRSGEAGENISSSVTLVKTPALTDANYGSVKFTKDKRTLYVVGADNDATTTDIVTLVSHASQHPSD